MLAANEHKRSDSGNKKTKKGALVVLWCDAAARPHDAAWPYGHIAEVQSDAARSSDAGATGTSGSPAVTRGPAGLIFKGNALSFAQLTVTFT